MFRVSMSLTLVRHTHKQTTEGNNMIEFNSKSVTNTVTGKKADVVYVITGGGPFLDSVVVYLDGFDVTLDEIFIGRDTVSRVIAFDMITLFPHDPLYKAAFNAA